MCTCILESSEQLPTGLGILKLGSDTGTGSSDSRFVSGTDVPTHMASVGGSAVPDPNPEGADAFRPYQHVNCYIQVYAPTTVLFGTAVPKRSPEVVESSSESDIIPSRRQSSGHRAPSVSSVARGRAAQGRNLIGRRQAVLAWLIARLQKLRERVSRPGVRREADVEERAEVREEQQIAVRQAEGPSP